MNRRTGRVPIALYICADDTASAELLAGHARRYAWAREWTVALTAVDTDPTEPLEQRRGWRTVTAALSERRASGVVTWSRAMLHDDPAALPAQHTAAFDRLAALLRDRGQFLAAADQRRPAPTARVPRPATTARHTPAQVLRRRELADIAAGWPQQPVGGDGSDPRKAARP